MVDRHSWPREWPGGGDAAAGLRLVERLAGTQLLAHPEAERLLRCLGSHSPYLADLAAREHAALLDVLTEGPDRVVRAALDALHLEPATPRPALAAALRRAKRVVALAAAVADIAWVWRLDQVTGALSDLAYATLRTSVDHLLHSAAAKGDWTGPGGFAALAMGKLGGRELNFSSDIDLVLLHDPERGASATATRMARQLVALLEARDADGYVFRVDLRLRPDPAATPPSVAVPAALAYYESLAQTWERAAFIRARPAAGDLALGETFLDAIRPFVWRKALDFAAIADLHGMKQRIDAHKGGLADGLLGLDVKLGRGGIREVEFVAQTSQLVWGGRDPELRLPRTVPALRLLARRGHLPARAAGELVAAYRFLRRVEHRLQMVADRQTHRLPEHAEGLAQFARFMGFADAAAFAATLRRHQARVVRRYAEMFARQSGDDAAPEPDALDAMGFADPPRILARLAEWRRGDARALRSERARDLLGELLPELLAALSRQADPDQAFSRFDRLLSALPAGVPMLSLLARNPRLVQRLAAVFGAAAPLAEHLASTPSALEGLLSPAEDADPETLLSQRLGDARDLDEAIRAVQRSVREEDFAISLATLEGRLDADAAGLRRTALADATIRALLPRVLADVERRYGAVPGGGLAVVLLGKAGGREMMAGSDLDLMFVYEHPPDVAESAGPRPLPPAIWFVRAVNAMVAALTAPDVAGALYAIDMRLRPSGNKGPVAVSLTALRHYHRPGGEAWTWERMALARARVAAGSMLLGDAVEAVIRTGLAEAGVAARSDAAAMRARMQRDHRAPAGLAGAKLRPGGLVDVEFIAQALLLSMGVRDGAPRPLGTRSTLLALREWGALDAADAALLVHADHVWRTVQGMLRLVHDGEADPPPAAAAPLLAAVRAAGMDAVDVAGLHARLDRMAKEVRAAFVRLVGPVGGEA